MTKQTSNKWKRQRYVQYTMDNVQRFIGKATIFQNISDQLLLKVEYFS